MFQGHGMLFCVFLGLLSLDTGHNKYHNDKQQRFLLCSTQVYDPQDHLVIWFSVNKITDTDETALHLKLEQFHFCNDPRTVGFSYHSQLQIHGCSIHIGISRISFLSQAQPVRSLIHSQTFLFLFTLKGLTFL